MENRWLSSGTASATYTCTCTICQANRAGVETTNKQSTFVSCWFRYGRDEHSPYSTNGSYSLNILEYASDVFINSSCVPIAAILPFLKTMIRSAQRI